MNKDQKLALKELKKHKSMITRQQMLTIRGQILAGLVNEAMKGLRGVVGGCR